MSSRLPRISTGIPNLDEVLLGGLPKGHVCLLEGDPGTGKTTVATQFLLEGRRQGERCLYVSLAESKEELEQGAQSHGWSLEDIPIVEFVPDEAILDSDEEYTVFHPREVELYSTIKKLTNEIERINPERLVIDSLSEFRLLAQDEARYRKQLLALKRFFSRHNVTVLLIDDLMSDHPTSQFGSIVHGILRLENLQRSYGVNRRRIQIVKMRGLAYREGYHDYEIGHPGVTIFPRLVASEHGEDLPEQQTLSSGLPALDALFGGGIDRGSSTLILGPTGVGKSAIGMQFAFASAARGERAVLYTFDEDLHTTKARTRGLGLQIDSEIVKRHLCLEKMDPAELSPGELIHRITREAEERDAKVIVLDGLNGLQHSLPEEHNLALQLHELLVFLGRKNVATFLVLTQHGDIADYRDIDVSYLADNVLLLRYFEAAGSVHRAVSALKKRSGPHPQTIRELLMDSDGIHLGEQLTGFQGILSCGRVHQPRELQSAELQDVGKR
jgi:circadian clock protein KaiC